MSERYRRRPAGYAQRDAMDSPPPASLDPDGCMRFDMPGEVIWSLTPTGDCPYQQIIDVAADHLRFTVGDGSGLRLGFDDWRARAPDRLGDDVVLIGLAPGRSLADLREDPSDPRLVIADALDTCLVGDRGEPGSGRADRRGDG